MRYFKKVEDWFFGPKYLFCLGMVILAIIFGVFMWALTIGNFRFNTWMLDTLDLADRIME